MPDRPFSPNRALLIAGSAVAGLLLGLVLALGIELVNRPVRSPRQLEQLDLPVIGLVPLIKTKPQPRNRRLRGFLSREKRLAA
jgi:capsular polysaccharide biosynthesis protein